MKVRYTVENQRSGNLKIGSGRVPMGGKETFELSPAQLAELMNTARVTLTKYSAPKPSTTTTASDDTIVRATTASKDTHTARPQKTIKTTKSKENK